MGLEIIIRARQKCGHYFPVEFSFDWSFIRRFFSVSSRMCNYCYKEDQKRRMMLITEVLELRELRGSWLQYTRGSYSRAEIALSLRAAGYSRKAIVPFLNSTDDATFWTKSQRKLQALFEEFIEEDRNCLTVGNLSKLHVRPLQKQYVLTFIRERLYDLSRGSFKWLLKKLK